MLKPPQFLVTLGVEWLSARATRRLRQRGWALAAQQRQAARLRRHLAATDYGRTHGIEAGMDDQTWRARVPLRLPGELAPEIERMRRGEADVLWPGRCHAFALSAGTTGAARALPLTQALGAHFRRAGLDALAFFVARAGPDVLRGEHVLLGDAASPASLPLTGQHTPPPAGIARLAALHWPAWARPRLHRAGDENTRIDDWDARLEGLARSSAGRDIRALAGLPEELLALAHAVRAERAGPGAAPGPTLREIWPRLGCVVHGGAPLAPYAEELRAVCGAGVRFHEIYATAEGFVAAQDAEPEAGLRLLADAGIHYEFLPLAEFEETRLAQLGPRALPLEAVRPGIDYVLIMTTPGGLARVVIGDVVRFVSTEAARLVHVGRIHPRLDAFGERGSERELGAALAEVCRRRGWRVVDFHVAPLGRPSLTGQRNGRHEWWLELRAGSEITPTGPVIAPLLDAELRRLDPDYDARRKGGRLLEPIVRLVMPGVFEQWRRATGRRGDGKKMPRCRGDRRVADELARYSPFHDAV